MAQYKYTVIVEIPEKQEDGFKTGADKSMLNLLDNAAFFIEDDLLFISSEIEKLK